MNTRRRSLLLLIAVLALAGIAYYFFGSHRVPANQAPLADLNEQSLQALQADFNEASSKTRIILLLSPT